MSSSILARVAPWASILALAVVVIGAPVHELAHSKWPGAGLSSRPRLGDIRKGRTAKALEASLDKQSALTARLRPHYNEAMFRVLGAVTPNVTLGKDDNLFLTVQVRNYPPPQGLRVLDTTCAAIARVARWFEDNGTVVELMVIPRKATVHPHLLPDELQARFVPVYPRILESLTQAGRPCVDLAAPFRASSERVYLPNDDHWDHPGAIIAVREIGARLRQRFEGRELPGTPVTRQLVSRPTFRFSGALVRMLGFREDGALLERFKVDRTPIVAVDSANPTVSQLGVNRPEPIVVVGTSFSAGFFTASLLSAELGREVENRAREGHAAGYRIMDLAREILLGEREFPKVLVWEFPEEFLVEHVRALVVPLDSIVAAGKAPAPLVSSPLRVAARKDAGVRITAESEGRVEGVSSGDASELVFELQTPLPGDGSLFLSYDLHVNGSDLHSVSFDGGAGQPSSAPTEFLLLRNDLPNRILVPIAGPDATAVKRVRLRFSNALTEFKLSPLELWSSAADVTPSATERATEDGR